MTPRMRRGARRSGAAIAGGPESRWNRWRYHYPQVPFPYEDLVTVNAARNRFQPEYELLDTGAFDGGASWIDVKAFT